MTGESHRLLREQVGAYALGQLSDAEFRAVDAHLRACPACRADLDEIAPVAGLLGTVRHQLGPDPLTGSGSGPEPPLSPELIAEVRAAAGNRSIDTARSRRFSASRWLPLAAASTVVALAAGALGFIAGGAGGGPAVTGEAVAVRALDPGIRAEAGLVAHTWGTEVKLIATGFRPGTTYRVTVTSDDGRTVNAGEFIGTGDTQLRCNLNSSVLRADAATVQVAGPDGAVVLDAAI